MIWPRWPLCFDWRQRVTWCCCLLHPRDIIIPMLRPLLSSRSDAELLLIIYDLLFRATSYWFHKDSICCFSAFSPRGKVCWCKIWWTRIGIFRSIRTDGALHLVSSYLAMARKLPPHKYIYINYHICINNMISLIILVPALVCLVHGSVKGVSKLHHPSVNGSIPISIAL